MSSDVRYCLCCHKPYEPRPIKDNPWGKRLSNRRTCSDECYHNLKRRPCLESSCSAREPRYVEIERACQNCGKVFTFQQNVNRDLSQRRACSSRCEAALKAQAHATRETKRASLERDRERQMVQQVFAPKITELEQRLDFYQQRGLKEQVRLLKQQINELLGA